jgi:hypothetical protein
MINYIHTPPKFSPVYTDGLFFTVSADTNYFKFRYVYDLYADGVLIFQGKATPNPFGLGVIDVSRILKSYVANNPIASWNTTPIYTHQTFPFSRPYLDETINYQVFVGYEYADSEISQTTGFTGNGNVIGSPAVTEGLFKTFQSTMGVNGKSNLQDFDIGQFVLSGTPTGTDPTIDCLFLTNSPRNRNLDPSEYYTLGFTNYYLADDILSEPYYVEYKFYDDNGLLITATTIDNITTNGGGPRVPCSYVYPATQFIYPSGNTEYNTLYVGAGPMNLDPILPPNAVQYTIQLYGKFTGTTTPIQPTPSPTPTPSSTPTISPCSGTCQQYSVTNNNAGACQFRYFDCVANREDTIFVPPFSSTLINCSCLESMSYECQLDIQSSGDCPASQPCITCYELNVTNNNAFPCIFTYYNCNTGTYQNTTLPGNSGTIIPCACPDVNSKCSGIDVVYSTICSGPTPTPTPTCSYKEWEITVCNSVCVGGVCSCGGSYTRLVYSDCSVTDIYTDGAISLYEVPSLSFPYAGFYTDGTTIFESSWTISGSVSTYCVIGGGC